MQQQHIAMKRQIYFVPKATFELRMVVNRIGLYFVERPSKKVHTLAWMIWAG